MARVRLLQPALVPAAILLVTTLALNVGPALPPSLSGLKVIGPYLILVAGAAMGLWFNRWRAVVCLLSLLAAYGGYHFTLELEISSFPARAVYTATTVLVPMNFLIALVLPERGVAHHFNYRWLLLGVGELMLVGWIASAGRSALSGVAWHNLFEHWLLRSPPMPLAGRLLFVAAFVAAAARTWPKAPAVEPRPLDIGQAGALVAFFIACEWAGTPGAFGAFIMAAGAILLASLLQESHRLAFRDELTELPSRRALEERLHALGPAFAIAMLDVDHFKQFNDTYGHDTGDQVLKLVAAHLAGVAGGTAYRYGGEEFCLVFAERGVDAVLPQLEALRAEIAAYQMAVRASDRPRNARKGTHLRLGEEPERTISVTVSIGVAEPDAEIASPENVLRAADRALYRAKEGGRNRVSR